MKYSIVISNRRLKRIDLCVSTYSNLILSIPFVVVIVVRVVDAVVVLFIDEFADTLEEGLGNFMPVSRKNFLSV